MNRSIYRKLAKRHGVSVAEVRKEMRLAIEAAYVNPNTAALAVPRKGAIPTPEEFTDYCVSMINPQLIKVKIPY